MASMENMKKDKEKLHKRYNQLMDEQKKSDCMAQKKKKPASGSTGKKKKKTSERAKLWTDKRMKDKTLPEKSWVSSA